MKTPSWTARASWALLIALYAGFALSGCSSDSAGDTKNSNSSSANAADAADEGNSDISNDDKLPRWVSDNYPLFPDSKVSTATDSGMATTIGFMVTSSDSQQVFDWLTDHYSQDGWKVELAQDELKQLAASNSDGFRATISVNGAGDGAVYVLSAFKA